MQTIKRFLQAVIFSPDRLEKELRGWLEKYPRVWKLLYGPKKPERSWFD